MTLIDARWALTETGWRAGVRLGIGDDGRIATIGETPPGLVVSGDPRAAARQSSAPPPDLVADIVVPGMPDAHCHASQYGIAGLAERPGARAETFWSWRERMYASLAALDATALEQNATALYRRLRAAGYTSVVEFHYVHRLGAEAGRRASLATALESAQALARAAATAGVGLLLLPVLYRWGGFDRAELGPRQARFALAREDYRRLFEALLALAADPASGGLLSIGVAPHSLRACAPDDLRWLLELRAALAPDCPVHIQVAEQLAEVRDAQERLGATPIEWLCANAPVDGRWTLIHATHASPPELLELRRRGATVCVCTTTEANLGDGFFPIEDWFAAGGSVAIGSDSNVGVDPAEELRWLEYQARLRRQARAVLVEADCPHPGTALWRRAVAGGRRASGIDSPGIAEGARAELLLLSSGLVAHPDEALDDFVFARRVTRLAASVTVAGMLAYPG